MDALERGSVNGLPNSSTLGSKRSSKDKELSWYNSMDDKSRRLVMIALFSGIILTLLAIVGFFQYKNTSDLFCPTLGVYPVPNCERYNDFPDCESLMQRDPELREDYENCLKYKGRIPCPSYGDCY